MSHNYVLLDTLVPGEHISGPNSTCSDLAPSHYSLQRETISPPTHFAYVWYYTSVIVILGHTAILCTYLSILTAQTFVIVGASMAALTIGTLLISRKYITTSKTTLSWTTQRGPGDEADDVDDRAIYYMANSSWIICAFYAYFMWATYEKADSLQRGALLGPNTLTASIQGTSIVLYLVHRILRPADRADPLRTVVELDAVDICLDGLDSASLYGFHSLPLPDWLHVCVKIVITIWLVTVGIRLAALFCVHLSPVSKFWGKTRLKATEIVKYPTLRPSQREKDIDESNTWERVKTSLAFRSQLQLVAIPAEIAALAIRITVGMKVGSIELVGELAFKNLAAIWRAKSAHRASALANDTKHATFIPNHIQYVIWGVLLCLTYGTVSGFISYFIYIAGSTYILATAPMDSIAVILLICAILMEIGAIVAETRTRRILLISAVTWMLVLSPSIKFPWLFVTATKILQHEFWVNQTVTGFAVVVFCASKLWRVLPHVRISAPIRDQTVSLLVNSLDVEIVFDVLSGAEFFSFFSSETLSQKMMVTCMIFSVMEIFNADLCAAVSGWFTKKGEKNHDHEEMPRILAMSRGSKVIFDSAGFVIRTILWLKFGEISSVFLVKNLYNILHTLASVERPLRLKSGSTYYGPIRDYVYVEA